MNSNKFTPKKNKAQAMVEFAIALPILLMLLYGILEVGRLLFTYSSIVNATRQAVRWGSTTGMGDRGTPDNTADDLPNVLRYQDCAGIRASAQRGDFLNVVDDTNIIITYDTGPGTSQTDICTGSYDTAVTLPTGTDVNKGRINVEIEYTFTALVPNLVPFVTRDMTAASSRTIVESITIGGPSGGIGKKNGVINILAVPDPSEVGQTVTVTVTITGDGTNTPTGTVAITGTDADCTITLSGGTGSCNVVFTSVGSKTITGTYSGDDNYNGGNNTESHTVVLALTNTIITSDTPDPSNVNGTVNVNVTVTSGAWAGTPTGTVTITGADTNCTITLSGGSGNCLVTFTSAGSKTITATYNGDAAHAGSFDTEAHTVVIPTAGPSPTNTPTLTPAPTSTKTPTPVPSACEVTYVVNQWDTGFTANVTIKNNTGTAINGWTLSWVFTEGQTVTGPWNASVTQNGGAVSASNLSYNAMINPNGGTVSFGFNGTHSGNNPGPAGLTLNGTPCSGGIPLPTATPSPIPTSLAVCNQVSHGPLIISNSSKTMTMTITNSTGVALTVQDVTVTWNHDKGRSGGSGQPLPLEKAALGTTTFWTGSVTPPAGYYIITPASLTIPVGGPTTITFTFKYNYNNQDGTERIYITLSTPGCQSYPIDSNVISNPN